MKDVERLVRKMFTHLLANRKKIPQYESRKRFIETFTPVVISINQKYSYIVEKEHIENYGFEDTGSTVFENNKISFFDKNENCLEFDFKHREMSISNTNNDFHYLIQTAKVDNLMIFHSIMVSLGFKQNII